MEKKNERRLEARQKSSDPQRPYRKDGNKLVLPAEFHGVCSGLFVAKRLTWISIV